MVIVKISYPGYNGETYKEDFYFNLTQAEITEMQFSEDGGLSTRLQRIIDAKSTPEILAMFKKIILTAYGSLSQDGKRFIKKKELTEEFTQTEAYSKFFIKILGDVEFASAFSNGIGDTSGKVTELEIKEDA